MSKVGEAYTAAMAPPLVQTLDGLDGMLRTESDSPFIGVVNAARLVKSGLRAVNWESVGLPDKVLSTSEGEEGQKAPPSYYVERLTEIAFSDTRSLVGLCEQFVASNELPNELSFGQLLLNSKRTLLTSAELGDEDKNSLLLTAKRLSGIYIGESLRTLPLEYAMDPKGELRLDWSAQLKNWITAHKTEQSGCPARKVLVTGEAGHKQPLTHYFWDKIVQAMYPV